MRLLFIFLMSCHVTNGMDVLRQYQKKVKKNNEQRLFKQELCQPVCINEKGEEFYFIISKDPLSKEFQEYMKLLESKNIEHEEVRIKEEFLESYKKRQKTEIAYQRLSILCIILGHIAVSW